MTNAKKNIFQFISISLQKKRKKFFIVFFKMTNAKKKYFSIYLIFFAKTNKNQWNVRILQIFKNGTVFVAKINVYWEN